MTSCRGRRVRGYISKTWSEPPYQYLPHKTGYLGTRYLDWRHLSSLGPQHTYVAYIIWLLLEFCQLLWADDRHFGIVDERKTAIWDMKE